MAFRTALSGDDCGGGGGGSGDSRRSPSHCIAKATEAACGGVRSYDKRDLPAYVLRFFWGAHTYIERIRANPIQGGGRTRSQLNVSKAVTVE